jgi:hypothetical protein
MILLHLTKSTGGALTQTPMPRMKSLGWTM